MFGCLGRCAAGAGADVFASAVGVGPGRPGAHASGRAAGIRLRAVPVSGNEQEEDR